MLDAVLSLAMTGLVFGALLAYAAKKFAVPLDPRLDQITKELPGTNCGACGYASCAALADSIASGSAAPDACNVGGGEVARKIAGIMGVSVEDKESQVARVMCIGGKQEAKELFTYQGLSSCRAAVMPQTQGGPKACNYGCLGLGDCVKACSFGAIRMDSNGLPEIIDDKCTTCGNCVGACPRSIIRLVGRSSTVHVRCSNKDKGAVARKLCKTACIACKRCEKACEHDAVKVEDKIALIDYSKCTNCGACALQCRPKCIIDETPEAVTDAVAS